MTMIGGLGHTMPYLLSNFHYATTFAIGVVIVELAVISWIRWKWMDTPLVGREFSGDGRRTVGVPGGVGDWGRVGGGEEKEEKGGEAK